MKILGYIGLYLVFAVPFILILARRLRSESAATPRYVFPAVKGYYSGPVGKEENH